MGEASIAESDIHAAIDRLYEAALDPGLLPGAFDQVAKVCGGMGITLFPRDPTDNPLTFVSAGIREAAAEYFAEWLDRCPRIAYSNRNPIFDRVFWDGDILDRDAIERDPYFCDYGNRHDLRFSVIRSTTALDRNARYIFSSPYSSRSGVPAASQVRAFDILSGHAVRALQVYRRIAADHPAESGIETLLAHQDHGVLVVNAFGKVTHANHVANGLARDGLAIVNGRAVAASGDAQKALDTLIRQTIWPGKDTPALSPVALPRGHGRRPLLLHASPLRTSERLDGAALLRTDAGAIVIIVDPEREPRPSGFEAFRLLGLTMTEARIAAILGTGASPDTAAETLGISIGTVRNHIKRIFSKLDIARQGELVRLAARLAALSDRPY